jgi:hypothetical protein
VHKEEFSITCYGGICILHKTPTISIRDKPILSSERMLLKEYDCKRSVEKKFLVVVLKDLDAKTNRLALNRRS